MRVFAVVSAIACALVVPTLATAGGWASVGFAPLPDGTAAGETWKPTIFVKQHGITPLAGLQPAVLIEKAGSGESTTFLAAEASEAGVYGADVVFPSPGDWRITVMSGFGDSQVTYGPVTIGAVSSPGGGSDRLPVIGFGVLALTVLAAFGLFAAWRSRRLTPASG
jgi:hypothetical protein